MKAIRRNSINNRYPVGELHVCLECRKSGSRDAPPVWIFMMIGQYGLGMHIEDSEDAALAGYEKLFHEITQIHPELLKRLRPSA